MENVYAMDIRAKDVNFHVLKNIMALNVPKLVNVIQRLDVKDLMEVVFVCLVLEEEIVHKKSAQLTDLAIYVNILVLVI